MEEGRIHVALTIAGSDPSGGAGIQADLKTFHQFGVYGTTVVTLLTVQNTRRLSRVEIVAADLVRAQLEAVLEDIPPNAVKTGALGDASVVKAVAACAREFRLALIVDPIMFSGSGTSLLSDGARSALVEELLPCALLVTPNLAEATALSGLDVCDHTSMELAARRIATLGARGVLIKGGHLDGDPDDLLFWEDAVEWFPSRRVATRPLHGTGCTLSAAITAELANGRTLPDAVASAKRFITLAIESSLRLGSGRSTVNHFVRPLTS